MTSRQTCSSDAVRNRFEASQSVQAEKNHCVDLPGGSFEEALKFRLHFSHVATLHTWRGSKWCRGTRHEWIGGRDSISLGWQGAQEWGLKASNERWRVIDDRKKLMESDAACICKKCKKIEVLLKACSKLAQRYQQCQVFAHPLPFNVIPHIDSFQSNGYTKDRVICCCTLHDQSASHK